MDLADAPVNHHILGSTLYRPAYLDFWNLRGPVIMTRPIGLKEHVLVQEDPRYQFAVPSMFAVDGQTIVYAVSPFQANGPVAQLFIVRPPRKRVGLKMATAPAPPPITLRQYIFRETSIKGGPPRDLAAIRATSIALVKRNVFWIPGAPQAVGSNMDPGEIPELAPERGDLKVMSLIDGSQHILRANILLGTILVAGGDGVFWTEPEGTSHLQRGLYYASAADLRPLRVGNIGPEDVVRWSVECRGALYWLQTPSVSHGGPSDAGMILSHDLARAANSLVLDLGDVRRRAVQGSKAAVWRDSVYVLLKDVSLTGADDEDRICLCRLTPQQANHIEVLRKFPPATSQFQFDDGYLYYISKEKHVGPLQALTDDSPGPVTSMLYRARLP